MARTSETTSAKDDTKKRGKRNADGTKKPGRLKQMFEVFKYTQEVDRSTLPLMILAIVGAIAVGVLLTVLIFDSPWYGIFMGLAVGVLIAMLLVEPLLARRPWAWIALPLAAWGAWALYEIGRAHV